MLKDFNSRYIKIKRTEIAIMISKGILLILLFDYCFYKSYKAIIPLLLVGIIFVKISFQDLLKKKRNEIKNEFKEFLVICCTKLKAGFSVENSMINTYEEMVALYGKDSFVCYMIRDISNAKKNNRDISSVFINIGNEVGVEDIKLFGEIYTLAYAGSGSINNVMENTALSIVEQLELENAIFMTLNEKIFEMKIMCFMPFLIMFYISLTNRNYFANLYHNVQGIIVMSICLGIYMSAYLWGKHLLNIEVV